MRTLIRKGNKNICHILEDGARITACGLIRVNAIRLGLHTVEVMLPPYSLCKHCERISQEMSLPTTFNLPLNLGQSNLRVL